MAVANMHVRWDWKELIDHDGYKTVSTLCGKKSTRRLVGIPGITEQPHTVHRKDGTEQPGWCNRCLYVLASSIPNDDELVQAIEPVREVHMAIRKEMLAVGLVTVGYFKHGIDALLGLKNT